MPAFAQKAGGHADRCADRHSGPRNSELGESRRFREYNSLRLMRPRSPAMPRVAPNVFTGFLRSCHGPEAAARGLSRTASYLALVSDQHLRTVIIVGMPNLGMPDWRSHSKPLTDADVTRCRRMARCAAGTVVGAIESLRI